MNSSYHLAQSAISDLKGAIYSLLQEAPEEGLSNAEIGRSLGIYSGHVRHKGHISRTLLALMEEEEVVKQDSDKKWHLANTS